jgi:hypothetical protein
LADKARDAYGIANAAWHAGVTLARNGHPDDGLKCFQLGQLVLAGFQPGKSKPAILRADDPRVATLTARLKRDPAITYALLGDADQAQRSLGEAHEGWVPRDAFERAGMDLVTAGILLDLSRFDTAEQFAASAMRTYGEGHSRSRTMAELMVAELHVRTGEPGGLMLAHQAIDTVSTLQSVSARRQRLIPLAAALEARPGSEARDLARAARQIAATRA